MMKAPKSNVCRAVSFETRGDSDGFTLEGYAAVFDAPTLIDSWEGRFEESIARGAFKKSLSIRQPVLQFDHGRDLATGSVPIGAIEDIGEDRHGLFVRARLHDNQRVEPIRQAIASGAIDGMSFRFRVTREEWDESGDPTKRTIREAELFELGPVVFPAYEATTVGVRSLLAVLDSGDRERLLVELARELCPAISTSDAAPSGTSEEPPTQPDPGHLGITQAEREAFFRSLILTKEN